MPRRDYPPTLLFAAVALSVLFNSILAFSAAPSGRDAAAAASSCVPLINPAGGQGNSVPTLSPAIAEVHSAIPDSSVALDNHPENDNAAASCNPSGHNSVRGIQSDSAVPVSPADPISGREPGPAVPFLLSGVDVKVLITGPIAHAVVTQSWENPNSEPLDGLYIFPLPENAAVTDMSLRIGSRLIRSEIKRREEARAVYEQAKSEGRVAGLLDQERPNIFTQRVANIRPGARIEVVLSFDHAVRCEGGACEYSFPTVVGPRFIPERQVDPGLIDPPVLPPGQATGRSFSLSVDLEGAVPIEGLESPSHSVALTQERADRARVALAAAGGAAGGAAMTKDFRLRWRAGGKSPKAGLLAWRDPQQPGDPGVFTLLIQPPADVTREEASPRELVFVLDCSGSMRGAPLEAAKQVVRKALGALRPADTFQIIRFSETASGLGADSLASTPQNIRRALSYLETLSGEGGTEMVAGIRAALDRPADPQRLRIVAFLTDGYIGNEDEILGEVRRLLGSSRLFSFGIGSAVNRYLLEGLAEEGRGVSAFLAPRETPDEMVRRFVARIATPVLTDLRLIWEGVEVEDIEPAKVPDLFDSGPLVIQGRYRKPGTGLLRIEGLRRGRPFTLREVVDLPPLAADHEALGRLWARTRIHSLGRLLHDGNDPQVREQITGLGLHYRLMTPWTSFVAVDNEEAANRTGSSREARVPVDIPEDVSYEGIFGPAGAPPAPGFAPALAKMRGPAGSTPGPSVIFAGGGVVGGAVGGVVGGVLGGVMNSGSNGTFAGTDSTVADRALAGIAKAESKARTSTQADVASRPDGDLKRAPGSAEGTRNQTTLPDAKAPHGAATGQSTSGTAGKFDEKLPFTRLTWVRADGTRIVVEADGRLTRLSTVGTTLVRRLSPEQVRKLRLALGSAHPPSWVDRGGLERLILDSPSGRFVISLPPQGGPEEAILAVLRGAEP